MVALLEADTLEPDVAAIVGAAANMVLKVSVSEIAIFDNFILCFHFADSTGVCFQAFFKLDDGSHAGE